MSTGREVSSVGGEFAWPGRILGNGRYTLLLTAAGGGYSRFEGYALTAWSGDRTRDAQGFFLYVRDVDDDRFWSAGFQPTRRAPARYQLHLCGACVEIVREDAGIEARMEACVAAEDPVELRRCSLTNAGGRTRRIELTTYAELALDTPAEYAAHPAFSRLFVETTYLPELQALLARRRPRSPDEGGLHLVHLLVPHSQPEPAPQYETDRARFLGRGRSPERPVVMEGGGCLSGTVGAVLDPILGLRRIVELAPGDTVRFSAVLGAGRVRRDVERLAERYASASIVEAAMEAARASPAGARQPLSTDAPISTHGRVVLAEAARIAVLAAETPRHRAARASDATGEEPEGTWTEEPLLEFNGYGGFAATGDEYVIRLGRGPNGLRRPPLPWINVIANEDAGFLVSESGAGCTWCLNSREHRLTPWYNDPITDPHGEALYLRDEEAGLFWSPTPGPTPGPGPYETRHGFGYTRHRHSSLGLDQDVWQYVPRNDPLKVIRLRLVNRSDRPRRLSAFAYFEWVLGGPSETRGHPVVTEHDTDVGALLAWRLRGDEPISRVAFATVVSQAGGPVHVSGDRRAFLGRYGSPADPAALRLAASLDGRMGSGLDPCAAIQVPLELEPGATLELAFLLGEAGSREGARALVLRYREPGVAHAALEEVCAFWKELVSGCQVDTGVRSIDLMVNGWLPYQDLSCRIWGRSALYQSGGAFGFRDQLQDAAALVHLRPALTRRQIVRHASHQFLEGDVLHWWHPPTGEGIRTRFSDDLLWLPHATAVYIQATGDEALLDERAPFLTARSLAPGEDQVLLQPKEAKEDGTIYEHCCRAIDRSLARGSHGLPLMGAGDWNDGMNRVGREGRGESVWLGFFLFEILRRWVPLCEARGARARARRYGDHAGELRRALNEAGWDGSWYRRAFYDNGVALGSAESDECRIDAIAQAWAVISGAAPPNRAESAMDALEENLVSEDEAIIRLLVPPFDRTPLDPGYIKGYVPGVRENGGQYTHAALWAVRALAELGRNDRAARLLEMLSPISHANTRSRAETYRVEPYVIAADVYGAPPHVGRGGWTWYTGSAGWMYRVAIESILGLQPRGGDTLELRPCLPSSWPGYRASYRLPDGRTVYQIALSWAEGAKTPTAVWVDDEPLAVGDGVPAIPLLRDGERHRIIVRLAHDATAHYMPATSSGG